MSQLPINLIHAEVLSPYARALAEGGAPVERLFEGCGIPLEAVGNPDAMITMRQGYRLMEEAARYAGEEDFGSRVGMDLNLYELGALGHAVQRAPTLYDAGKVVMAAIHASEPGSQCWIERNEKEAWFCYRPIERFMVGGAQAELFDLECLLQFIRLAVGDEWLPRKVRVTRVGAKVLAQTQHFAETESARDQTTTAIAFPDKVLTRPLAGRCLAPSMTSNEQCLTRPDTAPGISDAVDIILESLFEFESVPTLEAMAERFGMNGRKLQRSLAGEGTSYRELTERLLFRRAVSLLGNPQLSVKRIAAELGYSSPSSFVRAFSRIAGTTPMVYRKCNAGRNAVPEGISKKTL